MYWGINMVAEWAAENYQQVYKMGKASSEGAAAFMKQVPWSQRDRAGAVGTRIHSLIADGGKPTAEEAPYLEGLQDWFKAEGVSELAHEYAVFSDNRYGGTVDLMVEHPVLGTGVLDIKTGKGIYEDAHAQIAAYAVAEHGHPFDVAWAGILHVTAEGTTLHMTDIDTSFVAFDAAHTIADYLGKLNPPKDTT